MFPTQSVTGVLVDPSTGAPLAGARVTFIADLAPQLMRGPAVGFPVEVVERADPQGRVQTRLAQSVGAEGLAPQGWAWIARVEHGSLRRRIEIRFAVGDGPVDLAQAGQVPEDLAGELAEWERTRRAAEDAARRAEEAARAGGGSGGGFSAVPDPSDPGVLVIGGSGTSTARVDPADAGVLIIGG